MSTSTASPPRHIVEEAARWLVKVHEGAMNEQDRIALQSWRAQDSEHERVWQAADSLARAMGSVPPQFGMNVLENARRRQRRALTKTLAVLLTVAPGSWLAWHHGGREWMDVLRADYRTQTGERRTLVLEDGSRVILNTATALDVVYTDRQRTLVLHEGEIMVETGKDPQQRDFVVRTSHGTLRALGTRFLVRRGETGSNSSMVGVLQHAVEVRPRLSSTAPVLVQAGQQVSFSADAADAVSPLNRNAATWVDGMLVADKQRLDDFLAELSRYRPGVIHCQPDVAALKVSGVFRLDNTAQVLDTLQDTLPISIRTRTRYWVTVMAAEPAASR